MCSKSVETIVTKNVIIKYDSSVILINLIIDVTTFVNQKSKYNISFKLSVEFFFSFPLSSILQKLIL